MVMRRVFLKLVLSILVLGLVGLVLLLLIGGKLIENENRPIGSAPADFAVEPVSFKSESGAVVHGWWRQSSGEAKGTVLLLHGIRGDRRDMTERARFLSAAGYQCLQIDMQAHGETAGERIRFGHLESFDVCASLDFIQARSADLPIAIIGSSLGGAAAIFCQSDIEVSAIIMEGVFASVQQATENRVMMRLGSIGKVLAPLLYYQIPIRLGCDLADLRPVDRIHKLKSPVLIINGTDDLHATPAEAKSLFNLAPSPKELWLVPEATHVDLHDFAGKEYEDRVIRFLTTHL